MSLIQRIKYYIEKKHHQFQRGMEVTLQMKDAKERKRFEKAKLYEPGTIKYGLAYHQSIPDFFKDTYDRRKQWRREQEEKKSMEKKQ